MGEGRGLGARARAPTQNIHKRLSPSGVCKINGINCYNMLLAHSMFVWELICSSGRAGGWVGGRLRGSLGGRAV